MQALPSRCVASGPELHTVITRTPGEFTVEARDTRDAHVPSGGDVVKVRITGAAGASPTVSDLGDGYYKVQFMAPTPGTYQVVVTFNGEPIMGSPFKLTVLVPKAQAEMCKVSGHGLESAVSASTSIFSVTFIDKLGNVAPAEELDVRVVARGAKLSTDEDAPEAEIEERVQAAFDSFDEDGSGDIDVKELRQALGMLGMGSGDGKGDRKTAGTVLRRYDSDGGGLSIEEFAKLVADLEWAEHVGYTLQEVPKTRAEAPAHEVKYEVKRAGEYDLHVRFPAAVGGAPLPGSPFALRVVPAKAAAEQTVLPAEVTSGLRTSVGEENHFIVQAHDAFGNTCVQGGDRMRVGAVGGMSGHADDLGDGRYKVAYKGDASGVHKVSITINHEHVKGSPLTVLCEPGPIHVQNCELLHTGGSATASVPAGTLGTLHVRARDRFGNATSNNTGSVRFDAVMRARRPAGSDASAEGLLDVCCGVWRDGGLYELQYAPASRGCWDLRVRCVRLDGSVEEVANFAPIPIDVSPLEPDASCSVVLNASRWHGAKVTAGSRLQLTIELRDRFSNPCSWARGELNAEMVGLGVVDGDEISKAEAGPRPMPVVPRDEDVGGYDVRHAFCRRGRFSVRVKLGTAQLSNSPITFVVVASPPCGLKSRLVLPEDSPLPLVGVPHLILLKTRDRHGNWLSSGGAPIEVHVSEPPIKPGSDADHILAAKMACTVRDEGSGTYHIELTAAQPGEHSVLVRMGGDEVIGSPLVLQLSKPKLLASTKAAGKSRGETLYAVGAAIANAGLNWAYKTWAEYAYERRAALETLAAVGGNFLHTSTAQAFKTWLRYVNDTANSMRLLSGAVNACLRQYTRRAFNTWIDRAAERKELRGTLRQVLKGMSSPLLRAFNTWFANLDYAELHEDHRRQSLVIRAGSGSADGEMGGHSASFVGRIERQYGYV